MKYQISGYYGDKSHSSALAADKNTFYSANAIQEELNASESMANESTVNNITVIKDPNYHEFDSKTNQAMQDVTSALENDVASIVSHPEYASIVENKDFTATEKAFALAKEILTNTDFSTLEALSTYYTLHTGSKSLDPMIVSELMPAVTEGISLYMRSEGNVATAKSMLTESTINGAASFTSLRTTFGSFFVQVPVVLRNLKFGEAKAVLDKEFHGTTPCEMIRITTYTMEANILKSNKKIELNSPYVHKQILQNMVTTKIPAIINSQATPTTSGNTAHPHSKVSTDETSLVPFIKAADTTNVLDDIANDLERYDPSRKQTYSIDFKSITLDKITIDAGAEAYMYVKSQEAMIKGAKITFKEDVTLPIMSVERYNGMSGQTPIFSPEQRSFKSQKMAIVAQVRNGEIINAAPLPSTGAQPMIKDYDVDASLPDGFKFLDDGTTPVTKDNISDTFIILLDELKGDWTDTNGGAVEFEAKTALAANLPKSYHITFSHLPTVPTFRPNYTVSIEGGKAEMAVDQVVSIEYGYGEQEKKTEALTGIAIMQQKQDCAVLIRKLHLEFHYLKEVMRKLNTNANDKLSFEIDLEKTLIRGGTKTIQEQFDDAISVRFKAVMDSLSRHFVTNIVKGWKIIYDGTSIADDVADIAAKAIQKAPSVSAPVSKITTDQMKSLNIDTTNIFITGAIESDLNFKCMTGSQIEFDSKEYPHMGFMTGPTKRIVYSYGIGNIHDMYNVLTFSLLLKNISHLPRSLFGAIPMITAASNTECGINLSKQHTTMIN